MNPDRANSVDLPLSQRAAIDRLCDEFEAQLRAGQRPRIEDFLARAPEAARPMALGELLGVELDWLGETGQTPDAEDYRRRFPEHQEILEAELLRVAETGPCELPKSTRSEKGGVDTDAFSADAPESSPAKRSYVVDDTVEPERLGRYDIVRFLGGGAYGRVFLARDGNLARHVAIKIPKQQFFDDGLTIEDFVHEARVVAELTHPRLVMVHDVQLEGEWPYIVQEFIEGVPLGQWVRENRPSHDEIVRLMIEITEAVGFLHRHGRVHRDLKPDNILVDTQGHAHVADFGLALDEPEQWERRGERAGTTSYMSPELVRGETHRLDGRSDIWTLGVIFYELLTGRRPFPGPKKKLLEQILELEPRPPRMWEPTVPRELSRICLKCLQRLRDNRYESATDLLDDLRQWNLRDVAEETVAKVQSAAAEPVEDVPAEVRVVPKGLRSFDENDADFFLELLPGPRHRDGLPESIRFWKTRIEQLDPDKTFSVGLLHGPSGCGKSSLVKAGLLPRLAQHVVPVYVEATGDETELRLLRRLAKITPHASSDDSLPDVLRRVRKGGLGGGRKLLIVLDQFEQWLNAWGHQDATRQLIDALRHCDGGHVQCLVLVREDFWSSVSRFFRELEVRMVEGENSALADLFDMQHSRHVLVDFGQAYGRLPWDVSSFTADQEQFLTAAVKELAEAGKVVCVRLALFAQMMKSRAWTPAALREVGGMEGLGVTFLEETFSSATAPPEHRRHQRAARSVLKALLPQAGTDIKGGRRSYDALLHESGYTSHPREDFDRLLEILDHELRLITPTDWEGEMLEAEGSTPSVEGEEQAESGPSSDPLGACILPLFATRYYQLTHDYLVRSLRDWLTRKQRESPKGRAELKLAERAELYDAKPERRHLPSVLEWLGIRCWTRAKDWTDAQRKMMGHAGRHHLAVWITTLVLVLSVGAGIREYNLGSQVNAMVASIEAAQNSAIPLALENLEKLPSRMVLPSLQKRFTETRRSGRLSLAYGLAHYGQMELDILMAAVMDPGTSPLEVMNLVTALRQRNEESIGALIAAANSATEQEDWRLKARLAIVAWHMGELSLAREMLRAFPEGPPASPLNWDPVQRTRFIAEFPRWSGDLTSLAKVVLPDDPGLRSGICLALGGVERPGDAEKEAWGELLSTWHVKSADNGTHGASRWAFEQWGLPLPSVETASLPTPSHDWWRIEDDLTMIRIPAGTVRGEKELITVERECWVSSHEVTVRQFQRFASATDLDWRAKPFLGLSPEDQSNHPVQGVSWYDAVRYCNWLSLQQGFDPCYEVEEVSGQFGEYSVTVNEGANGFRLPGDLEWEYACRAMTTTIFSFGDDEADLLGYGIFRLNSGGGTARVGSRRCNGWGLFDMQGNVWEWCEDRYGIGSSRGLRGGGWSNDAAFCRAAVRFTSAPTFRADGNGLGFRLALRPSGVMSLLASERGSE